MAMSEGANHHDDVVTKTKSLPLLGRIYRARISPPTRQGLLRGVLVYRWLTWIWFGAVFAWEVYERNGRGVRQPDVDHPLVGFALVAAAGLLSAWLTLLYQRDPALLIQAKPVLLEIAMATTLIGADVWVYGFADHPQSLPSVWMIAVIFTTAIAAGRRTAVITGAGIGLARYVGWLPFADDSYFSFARLATVVLLAGAGWIGGFLLHKLEDADRSISALRGREEVARTLHDGVLQTLAVIQRRSDDQDLVELARTQELELREYLFGATPVATDLATGLRAAARKAEQRYGLRVDVVTAPDLPSTDDRVTAALCGAAGEALTNASLHGGATKVIVYAEPTDNGLLATVTRKAGEPSVFVSVKDDGSGFDPEQIERGEGLSRSIEGRVAEVGGRVEVDGRQGRGAEIRLWA